MRWTLSVVRVLARLAMAGALGLALLSNAASAHDIPNQIVLNGFVKPEGERLHVLVRVPLLMFVGIDLPKWGPGYLALDRIEQGVNKAIEVTGREISLYEDGTILPHSRAAARISLPSDRSFESYESAIASIEGTPIAETEQVFWNQGYLDIHYEYPIRSERSDFALDFRVAPGLPGRLKMVVRYLPPGGAVRAYDIHGGFGRLALDPRWHQAARTFVGMGFDHILDGIDHLLFLLCLIVPFALTQFWRLVGIVTAFTVAHSITLIASGLGLVPAGAWFPPLVETLIAASIVYMALENIVVGLRDRGTDAILRHRWLVTGAFGLAHGFGFSFALRENLQFAGDNLLLSLLSFNVGVELGQLLVLAVILPVAALVLRTPTLRRFGLVILSAVLAHTAWHWMTERAQALRYADWPDLEPAWVAILVAFATLLGLSGVVLWRTLGQAERRRAAPRRPAE